ncbi:hypothetical protein ACFE04_014652 [Oxalis oulophora]
MLDKEFKVKFEDFGLAQMLTKDKEVNTKAGVAGPFGYIAPGRFRKKLNNKATQQKLNEKIKFYSFGVVVLKLATGREPNNNGDSNTSLAEWAWRQCACAEETPNMGALDQEIKEWGSKKNRIAFAAADES